MLFSSYFELSPPDSTRILRVACPPSSAFGALTLMKRSFSAFEAKLMSPGTSNSQSFPPSSHSAETLMRSFTLAKFLTLI